VTHIASPVLDMAEEATVSGADVAIVVTGLTASDEGEGFIGAGDRESLALPAAEEALIAQVAALNPATVVVLEGGSAMTLGSWVDSVGAVLMAWYPGLEGGNAIADVLFGAVVPSGRLPITFPVAEGDLPPFDNTSLSVTYGYLHGYRYLQDAGTAPRFPFGFGLSYTDFTYGNLQLSPTTATASDTVTVQVDVTNTSASVTALETVQLYVGASGSSVPRAPRDLRAFAQVTVAPMATETVSLALPVADLAFFDVGSGAWVVEPGAYTIEVGSSSEDLPLSMVLTVSGG